VTYLPTMLRGSSWDHQRGHAPMLAVSEEYARRVDHRIQIKWVPRSLKEFGVGIVKLLAEEYDLILVDHPHVGTMAESGAVVALDEYLDTTTLAALRIESPGRSYESYEYDGHLWALPVDAACQVSCWRPDLIQEPPDTWEDVVRLAESGQVLWPLCGVDAAASFFTLAALAGRPCGNGKSGFVDRAVGRWAIELMRAVASMSDPRCLEMNPIGVLDQLASCDDANYVPLLFGYVNYSRLDAPGARIRFGDVPAVGDSRVGALLGGVGIAVSSHSKRRESAIEFAKYVASPDVQSGIYFTSGGQPAHASAWGDCRIDRTAGGFFSGTMTTMRGAWTRPRYPRFPAFQAEMIEIFAEFLTRDTEVLLEDLEKSYQRSRTNG